MRHLVPAVLMLSLLGSGCSGRKLVNELDALIPETLAGWTAEETTPYDTETIFEYMNGAGELFLSYAYRGMLVRRFVRGENELTAEIYDMGSGSDAFGIFSRFRSGEEIDLGQGACYVTDHLNFWKGRYYGSVFAMLDEEGIREEILGLGRRMAERIDSQAPLPAVVERLPAADRDPASVRFFHLHTDLNRYYFVSDTNILDLDPGTDAALAAYERGDEYVFLVIIVYPEPDAAERAADDFRDAWMPEVQDENLVQVEDGLWSALARDGRTLAIVFDAPTAERARDLLRAGGF